MHNQARAETPRNSNTAFDGRSRPPATRLQRRAVPRTFTVRLHKPFGRGRRPSRHLVRCWTDDLTGAGAHGRKRCGERRAKSKIALVQVRAVHICPGGCTRDNNHKQHPTAPWTVCNTAVHVMSTPQEAAAPSGATDAVLKPSEPVPADAREVQGIDFNQYANRSITVEELVAGYSQMGFQATAVGEAVRIVNDMVSLVAECSWLLQRLSTETAAGPRLAVPWNRNDYAGNSTSVSPSLMRLRVPANR